MPPLELLSVSMQSCLSHASTHVWHAFVRGRVWWWQAMLFNSMTGDIGEGDCRIWDKEMQTLNTSGEGCWHAAARALDLGALYHCFLHAPLLPE
jgi:hypothetical protein